jgi:hypothetical protein
MLRVGEMDAVVGQHSMRWYGTAVMRWRRKSPAIFVAALSCNSKKAKFEVRSMATSRSRRSSSVRTSAMSMGG